MVYMLIIKTCLWITALKTKNGEKNSESQNKMNIVTVWESNKQSLKSSVCLKILEILEQTDLRATELHFGIRCLWVQRV